MNNNVWVVVPTYWGKNGTLNNPSDTSAFDHPTPIYGKETLERTVKNLSSFTDDFKLLILLAVTHEKYKGTEKKRVNKILEKYKEKKDIYLINDDDLDFFNKNIKNSPLNFKSYGAIRNVQLFIPFVNNCDYLIAIDT
ncbi:MAG: hypothetical protein PHD05_08725, partial [Sphaerochaetaceae bacterium]|nr:hypothetical protein [Sphaerochaetaceae bacterium]